MASNDIKYREDTVETWNLAIEDALEYRRKYGREAMWSQCEALFYHAHSMQDKNVGPNLIISTGDSLLSSLCVPNPFFSVKPMRMDLLEASPVLESTLNMLLYALGVKQTVDSVALDTFLYGRGIVKLGYDSEFGYEPNHDLGQASGTVLGMSLTQFDKKGSKIEYNTNITPGMPWVEKVLPHDFLVPWGTREIKKAPWCAHRIVRHIDDIKADPKYSNKKGLVPSLSMADYVKSYLTVMKPYRSGQTVMASIQNRKEFSDKAEFVEMWEIHDARTGRVLVLVQDHEKFLRDDIDYLQEDGLPFVSLGFVPGNRTFWTTPDVVYLKASQEEAIDIATISRKQRLMGTLRFGAKRGSILKDELSKALSGELGAFFEWEESGPDGVSPIVALNPPNNNQSLQQEAEYIRKDARETVGYGRNQVGQYEGGRKTATEVGVVSQSADQRLDRRQQLLADFYCDVGQKLAKIVFKFWKTPRLIEIIGPDGAAQWSSFVGSQLKGEYQYRVGFSSEPIETKQSRMQQALQMFQMLSQDPSIDQRALRQYLVRAFNEPSFTSLFLPGVLNNANLSNAMQGMQENVGGANPQGNGSGGAGGSGPVSGVQKPQVPAGVQ